VQFLASSLWQKHFSALAARSSSASKHGLLLLWICCQIRLSGSYLLRLWMVLCDVEVNNAQRDNGHATAWGAGHYEQQGSMGMSAWLYKPLLKQRLPLTPRKRTRRSCRVIRLPTLRMGVITRAIWRGTCLLTSNNVHSFGSECPASFKTRNGLGNHQRIHEVDRPHVCSDCGSTFVLPSELTAHMKRVHPTEKSWACEFCGKDFVMQHQLARHRNKHHICPCGYTPPVSRDTKHRSKWAFTAHTAACEVWKSNPNLVIPDALPRLKLGGPKKSDKQQPGSGPKKRRKRKQPSYEKEAIVLPDSETDEDEGRDACPGAPVTREGGYRHRRQPR
jgi:predicted RNA-binding Zn-ribbon protein involved in translation (DUF1610 family)